MDVFLLRNGSFYVQIEWWMYAIYWHLVFMNILVRTDNNGLIGNLICHHSGNILYQSRSIVIQDMIKNDVRHLKYPNFILWTTCVYDRYNLRHSIFKNVAYWYVLSIFSNTFYLQFTDVILVNLMHYLCCNIKQRIIAHIHIFKQGTCIYTFTSLL